MAKVAPMQGSFNSGEFSPLLFGRPDSERYKSAVAIMENMIPMTQGGATRRGGTKFINPVKTTLYSTRLIPFQYSIQQNYIIEMGQNYARFYTNYAQIQTAPNVAYELVTPYLLSDVDKIKFTQSDDVLYLVHPNYPPFKLVRLTATTFKFIQIDFQDGPYFDPHFSTKDVGVQPHLLDPHAELKVTIGIGPGLQTVSVIPVPIVNAFPEGGSGQITVEASEGTSSIKEGDSIFISAVTGTVEANGNWIVDSAVPSPNGMYIVLRGSVFVNAYTGGGQYQANIFTALQVGDPFRFVVSVSNTSSPIPANWYDWHWAKIWTFISPFQVQIMLNPGDDLGSTMAFPQAFLYIQEYRRAYWSDFNFPSCVVFHEDRLVFAGASTPQRLDGSNVSDYENFAPSNIDGTVVASNAYSFTLVSNDVNAIRWMTSEEQGMPIGSAGGDWILRASILNEAMTAQNVLARRITNFGSADSQAIVADKSSIYIDRSTRKVREMRYFYQIGGFKSTDLTETAEHITGNGISTEVVFTKVPQPIIWAGRNDQLLGMTFDRNLDALKAGWHRHPLGGQSDSSGTAPKVLSVAVIPSPDGTQDDLWMVVLRWIGGVPVRYIEYMTRIFQNFDLQENAYFVDCGKTYDAPIGITGGITKANPGVITAAAHGLADGVPIVFRGIMGMIQLNYNKYIVANATANTFTLKDYSGNDINTTTFGTYLFGGTIRQLMTTMSGLDHLNGETVAVFADGMPQNDKVVTGGAITLDQPAATVSAGYNYISNIQTLRVDAGASNGTSIGKLRRVNKAALMLDRSLGLLIGTDPNGFLDEVSFPNAFTPEGLATPLFSGIIRNIAIPSNTDTENQIYMRQNQPLPFTLLAVMPQIEVQDET